MVDKKLKYDVNIDVANQTKKEFATLLDIQDKRVLNKVGAFASLYDFSFKEYKEPVLVLKTEEPGSKQLLAMQYGKIENIAYDMINHLINDCIVMGARPLTVQDAIICGKLDKKIVKQIVSSIALACKLQGCVLTGGETSEQPGVLGENTYILTSSIVGVVEKSRIIDGSKIIGGDIVLGLESSGIHTNGYTLVRKIIETYPEIVENKIDGKRFIDVILEPHRCYYLALKDLFAEECITGMAHITGGGICENLNRILPEKYDAEIDLSKYNILEIFKCLKKYGNIDDKEMLRTFNLGVGMALVVKSAEKDHVINEMSKRGIRCSQIGEIIKGNKKVRTVGKLNWDPICYC